MNPSLRQMRAFVALAKTGSFTLAADHLNVTQSALSGQIKELESVLGCAWSSAARARRSYPKSAANCIRCSRRCCDDLDRAMAGIASRKALKRASVRIAAPQMMACTCCRK
jgi:DNA-binding transcriptional LysR family regulator